MSETIPFRPRGGAGPIALARALGGAMAAVDWSATNCGRPENWPPALRNTIGLMARSGFPMFVVWGIEQTLIYNDAYIPILGDRHPGALGKPFFSVWPEVREVIEPVIDAAFAGQESFFEDLEVTLHRPGFPERAWFTFSYSPILDDQGEIPGVLCVCVETTASVLNRQAAHQEQMRQRRIFEQAPEFICIMTGPDHIFDFVNEAHKRLFGSADWIGKPVREAFPDLVGQGFYELLDSVYTTGERYVAKATPVTFRVAGQTEEQRFLDFIYEPVRDESGQVTGIFCSGFDVTEQNRTRQQLVESEARLREKGEQLRLATDAAEVGLWDVDPISDTLYWPPRVKAMFGISEDRPVSMAEDFYPCLHPEDRDRVTSAFAAAMDPKKRALYDVEYRTIGKEDGIVRWVAAKGRGLFNAAGECYRVIGTAVDITERKRAEQALEEQAHSLEVLNATGTALAAELDLERIVQLVTDAGVDITGAQFGAFFYNVLNPAGESYMLYTLSGVDRSEFDKFPMPRNTAVFAPTFKGEGVVRSDDITRDPRYGRNSPRRGMPEGHLPVRSYLAVPVFSRSGEVLGGLFFGHSEPGIFTERAELLVQGVAGQAAVAIDNARLYEAAQREIVSRRQAEEQLRELNETLELKVEERTRERDRIFQLSTDLFAIAGFDGYLKVINPAWERLLGHSQEDLLSRPFLDLIHPDDRESAVEAVAGLASGRASISFEDRLVRADGSTVTVAWTAVPEGELFYAVGRDVTLEREREEQLRQSQKMEAIGQLTGGIAHDFNNLLTGIIGSLDLMQNRMRQGNATDAERFATAAITSANRAAALTHRLLAFSRRQPIDPKPVNANRMVASMEDLLRRTLGESISLEIVTAGGLWLTRCDANQLESALLNLAINARDAMPDGGKLTIETCNAHLDSAYAARQREVRPGQYVCICVTDTGTGMPPDVLSRAFDPFYTTKPIGQGTGLGLSMVYGFARQSDGYAKIYSEVGQGTTIKLYLPRFRGDEGDDEVVENLVTAEHRSHDGEVVLVVEDERSVRDLVVEVLKDLGYHPLEAADGPSGLKILEMPGRIDLLVTDVGLPGLNGRQMADAAREKRPDLKVLFMTGYAENAALDRGFLDKGMALITKPFPVHALATRIRMMIEDD
ncbi:MAG TPA: PAS domain-containing protein [Microvirga sp.]|nr:PAS domain-containing protein [Microvirga sp.]